MVRLNKIFTRTGDTGETAIGNGTRVSKLDLRIVAGGSVDETNSCIGVAASSCESPQILETLQRIQQWLFDLGADLSCPWEPNSEDDQISRVAARHILQLEQQIDTFNAPLSELKSFVLPGGSPCAARLHLARSVCRRAELDVIRLAQKETINPQIAVFLNRLSDLLFVLARVANDHGRKDVLWSPGS